MGEGASQRLSGAVSCRGASPVGRARAPRAAAGRGGGGGQRSMPVTLCVCNDAPRREAVRLGPAGLSKDGERRVLVELDGREVSEV